MKIRAKGNSANIRVRPNTTSNIVGTLNKTPLDVIRETPKHSGFKWYVVKINNKEGFVREDVIEVITEVPKGKKLTYLVIHCTATPEGRDVTKEDIIRWHTAPKSKGGRGWSIVGYSRMINLNK
jgi:hypothetical protein